MVLVRLLFFLALAAMAVSGLFSLFTKDRRYLRFIGKVLKFTLILLVVILVFFFFERLVAPML